MELPYLASAIELNNMAISLVERYHYSEALKTFKLALQVLQGNMTVSEVEHKLYQAQLYLQTENTTEISFEQAQRNKKDSPVRIRSFQGRDLLFRPADMTAHASSASTCSLVYLQESDLPEYESSVEIFSAVLSSILRNQAQVCRRLAKDEKDRNSSATFQKKAHQLSILADTFAAEYTPQPKLRKLSSNGVGCSATKSLEDIPLEIIRLDLPSEGPGLPFLFAPKNL